MGFDAKTLQARLAGLKIGWRLHFFDKVDSTNLVALELAQKGAAEGQIVVADCQTGGRGRLHRTWQSPPGCNLYASLLLRPGIDPADAPQLTLMAGVAAAEALSSFCPAGVALKWPNDVLIRGRKVCGILTELRMDGGEVAAVVVGIGVNVNMPRAEFDPAHRERATSLREETGKAQSREEAAFRLCEDFENWYETFRRDGFAPVREAWLARSEMPGRRVRVLFGDEVQEGRVAGIDHDGALLIADDLGAIRRVIVGDVDLGDPGRLAPGLKS